MRPYFIAGSILAVMMAFQNCAKTSDLVDVSSGQVIESSDMNKIRADQFGSLVLTDIENARSLDVDLANGEVRSFDMRGVSTGDRYCMGEQDREQLVEILSAAEVCEPLNEAPPEAACTTVYEFPYAQLRNASQSVNLGEKRSGCDIPVDLCGAKATQLKNLTVALLSRVEHMSCN